MNAQQNIATNWSHQWLRIAIATALLATAVFMGFVGSASANGAQQIRGIGYSDDIGACTDPEGAGADFATIMTGDLEGCQYVFVESYSCTPSGVYTELGSEIYVVEGPNGEAMATLRKAVIAPLRDRWTVKIGNGPDLDVQGNILNFEYEIGEGRTKVAQVSKKWFRIADTYGVQIEPSQNDIVILAITVAIDMMR